jgi:hypothetical protein
MPWLIGVIAVAVLGAAFWFGKGLFAGDSPTGTSSQIPGATGSSTPATAATGSGTSQPTATPTTEADPMAAAVASCRTAWGLQSAARNYAWTSLAQWNQHLQIMNNLQAGKIDLPTAKTQWPLTTKGAADNIVAFRNADKSLGESKDACAVDASATGPEADAVRQCAASMKTVDQVLVQARLAIAPWELHLKDQSHFKAGEITPAAAEAKWRALWQKGLQTTPGYNAVAPKGQQAVCNLPA